MQFHRDRSRATSFGSASDQYDQFRPSPPRVLLDDLVALRPVDVLDVGCGTGKVAVALAGRGLRVLGVEADERMAEVARGHGVPVEVAEFESWGAGERQFDLITCADAWDWIDPDKARAKAAAVLPPGGTLALLWSFYLLDDEVAALFQQVYEEYAPQARTHSNELTQSQGVPFEPTEEFGPFRTRTYRWSERVRAADWVGLLGTFSDHRALTPGQLASLQEALREEIENLGGAVAVSRGVHAAFTQRR